MKTRKQLIIACVAFFAMGSIVHAAETIEIDASVTVEAPTLTLTNPVAIDFGSVIVESDAATVIVLNSSSNADAIPTNPSSNASLNGSGHSGSFTVNSNIGGTLSVSCASVTGQNGTGDASGTNVLDDWDGNEVTMTVENVEAYTPSTLTVTADTDTTLYVGGMITISNTVNTTYSGTIEMSLDYQ